ncbi:MAG TPA: thiol:disulfide interchange protein DsbA/DsbL [Burkholderiales bacterium]
MRRLISLLVPLLIAAPLAFAQDNYTELKTPQPVEAQGGKIDVVEFFWYGCIHCYNLEPALESWVKKLPPDVQFRRVPAVFNPRWGHDAAIFYTFEAMGLLDKLHKPLFDAIHRGGLRTDNPQALDQWLQKQGVEPKKFNETMRSFAVQSKTRRAIQLTTGYAIEGTPAMAVQGRYVVNAGDGILQTVSGLVDRARKEK